MRRWQAAYLRPIPEMPLVGTIQPATSASFPMRFVHFNGKSSSRSAPLACLGLSAAANGWGSSPPSEFCQASIWRASIAKFSARMGFSPDGAEFRPNLFVRQPVFRKSVFRAAVTRDGILVSDIIQVWLDLTSPRARDRELAEEIRQRALAQIFAEQT